MYKLHSKRCKMEFLRIPLGFLSDSQRNRYFFFLLFFTIFFFIFFKNFIKKTFNVSRLKRKIMNFFFFVFALNSFKAQVCFYIFYKIINISNIKNILIDMNINRYLNCNLYAYFSLKINKNKNRT